MENAYTHAYTVGNFLLTEEDELYIEEDTLSCVVYLVGTNAGAKRSDGVEMNYADIAIQANGKRYLPFEEIMTGLCIGSHFDRNRTWLYVYEGADVLSSYTVMDEIFLSDAYAMRYWQNSETFELDMASAIAADIVTNYRYVSYASGEAVPDQYNSAFKDLMVPQKKDEILSASSNLDRRLDLLDSYFSVMTEASLDALKLVPPLGIIPDTLDCVKAVSTGLQTQEMQALYTFVESLATAEERSIRAMRLLEEDCGNADMRLALTQALYLYDNRDAPFWELAIEEYSRNKWTTAEKTVWSIIPGEWIRQLGNTMQEEYGQVGSITNAIITSVRYLEIQNELERMYYDLRNECLSRDVEDRYDMLADMHDVTCLYLKSAKEAYRALVLDNDMAAAAQENFDSAEADLEALEEYWPVDYAILKYTREAEAALIAYAQETGGSEVLGPDDHSMTTGPVSGGAETESEAGSETESETTSAVTPSTATVTVTWNCRDGDDYRGIDLFVTGSTADGGTVTRAPTEGVYLSNGHMIGEQIVQDGYISVIFHDLNGDYSIEISNGEDWALNNVLINDLDPVITLEIEGQDPVVISDLEDYYHRAPTGIWYYGFGLENGKLVGF